MIGGQGADSHNRKRIVLKYALNGLIMSRKTIVHISADFPDPLKSAKTQSVKNLLDNATGLDHFVYSLNRVSGRRGVAEMEFAPDRVALSYGAPPYGLWHATRLDELTDWIAGDIKRRKIPVDGFHVHKFSVEGLMGLKLSRQMGVPFIANIWGDTDLRIVKARWDLAPKWKEILNEAAAIIPSAPWVNDKFEALFGNCFERKKATVLAPITMLDTFQASATVDRPVFMTLFNLDSHKRKNFAALVHAISELSRKLPDIRLDVYGTGAPNSFFEVKDVITAAKAEKSVFLRGPLGQHALKPALNTNLAFLMPTRRETFGMVFIEALFAGLPLLHSKGWGIDGFFADDQVGYACRPTDPEDIKHGIEYLIAHQAQLTASIAALSAAGGLDPFKRASIVAAYQGIWRGILQSEAPA